MTWALESAKKRGGTCTIIYSETTQVDGEDVVATLTVRHFQDTGQNAARWHANIRREIVADLGGLNKSEEAEVDITSQIR